MLRNCPRAHNHRVRSCCFTRIFFFLSKLYFGETHHLFCTLLLCLSLIIASNIYGEEKKIKLKVYNCLLKICELTNPWNILSFLGCYRNIFQMTAASSTTQLGNTKKKKNRLWTWYIQDHISSETHWPGMKWLPYYDFIISCLSGVLGKSLGLHFLSFIWFHFSFW